MSQVVVTIPRNFNMNTMRGFIAEAVDEQAKTQSKSIFFDFSRLMFIEPEGITVLANTIEHFRQLGVKVSFTNHNTPNAVSKYLDDSGFFANYFGRHLFPGSTVRSTTMPLEIFRADNYVPYLYRDLVPWIAQSVQLSDDTLETIRACLEEIFHNIQYHSGVNCGCISAQHFPQKERICIAISDFGIGIPTRVRTLVPDILDNHALRQAVKEGFTTKTNVRNRGVGLWVLLKYITQSNNGTVRIHSGKGSLSAMQGHDGPKISTQLQEWTYPGTLVHVVLRTDTLERLEDDLKPEDFEW